MGDIRVTEVRDGLLLFTIFFNCSQTCAGVAELAIPAAAQREMCGQGAESRARPPVKQPPVDVDGTPATSK